MENFTNETIDTTQLPRFEEVPFTKLHGSYWFVMLIQIAIILVVLGMATVFAINDIEELQPYPLESASGLTVLAVIVVLFSRLSFTKKGFAFRNHDVLFRQGIIATNTIVIPYNRVQHVALHEGIIARIFGLAKVEIFTAGGSSSDIEIPGIKKEQAENIKQLLMGKIQKEL